ncbi:MAG: hypothetical protein JW913_05585 [Chitinispirillaceae bacterium]|nr:hypothetical protein [Chitinispirillaceae bacterium]
MYDSKDPQSIEKYSSAITLSDMEIFIFPELLYALVLANIMSPRIWKWRHDRWFSEQDSTNPLRRIHRLKQFIMDHFSFNLDLDTWGLTTKEVEIARFNKHIDEAVLAESNALFGYEGDKYYFDIDIRKHFGLDRYTSNVIPYWKTETVEAMEAFHFKEGYPTGAGECVSLSTLYAAAAFIVAGIPLDDIYLLATPLHSQNFFAVNDGILSNNRRILTKTMWFNGTEISTKARRALENERVTVVAHRTGYIHTVYDRATIDTTSYTRFSDRIKAYLTTPVTFEILANFLRQNSKLHTCFQIAHNCCGKPRYIEAEKVYHYEHSSKARVGDATRSNLLHEIEEDEFYTQPLPDRLMLDELEAFFKGKSLPADEKETADKLKHYLHHNCYNVELVVRDLLRFCRTAPRLPGTAKTRQAPDAVVDLDKVTSPEGAVERLERLRPLNDTADLAFTALRDLSRAPWKPFLKAALERNPVSINAAGTLPPQEIYDLLCAFSSDSIYDGPVRLAQPDEVWNYRHGDGLEKAICLMNILRNRSPGDQVTLEWESPDSVYLRHDRRKYTFPTRKKVPPPAENDFSFAVT